MPTVEMERRQVLVIGAGPSGAIAAALLKRKGHDVLMIERQHFPRFSIGESLLSHCLDFVEEAGMLEAVNAAGFQRKNGAAFAWGDQYSAFDFGDTFSNGKPTTFQVQRADFDKLLADQAELQGVDVRYGEAIVSADFSLPKPQLDVLREDGSQYRVEADFVLDASGYGRVLPRLLNLEAPSNFPVRQAVFTHVEDCIDNPAFDREKILITTHPTQRDIWFWTIPFSNGRCSVGVVAAAEHFEGRTENLDNCLRGFIAETPSLAGVLNNAVWDTPARTIGGYSANVKTLHGQGFALLGNAAEFLDPVFSSGVTIAMRSASMAAGVLHRQLQGESVDWQTEFAEPLKRGVNTFRCYVEGWYAGTFQDVIFYQGGTADIRRMISSILAGYAWDERNPFVSEPKRRLRMISDLCAQDPT
ncbi:MULTISPECIES: tryptophan 7-halogenase [Gammaproteobacteria]|uniref:tryptophan 7-halogenase n=1 Tax=Gammaproteobacteria TaxID=1236 RepID=UPI001914100B|nr:tryptophan 7-halogenase [Bacillus sp. TH86]MBK5311647.1 tryptophan 7-halogenase [Pseudomonas sp. TH71]MBK5317137.1 tryptophan 7-halogenase [Erwinia sp. TH79]MBK5322640.1 tryptophan 7-halogenase [Bacillus sp. TH59]MBK5337590.1 tryptophan 7-halogenase [Bacillus sp. TH57]MBK5370851.1 tryptophan 7-halogenase [Pseudomonas sp. TH40]MBK5382020.1 tryptophan 7-halogenase [Pseudomonas sp. TH35]MBK5387479.1 tryptophan 7-halogenase [Pseudomonas sp. TH38]MBK5404774.1 tryptophan 7-halogenase [Pseudomo